MKRIFSYFRPRIFKVILCLFIKISGIIAELFIPILLSYILDTVVDTGTIVEIALYGLLMILLSGFGFLNAAFAAKR